MMSAADIPFLATTLTVGIVVTALIYFALNKKREPSTITLLVSAIAFPAILLGGAIYVGRSHPDNDPHGFVMAALVMLALASLPLTIVTTAILAKVFARGS